MSCVRFPQALVAHTLLYGRARDTIQTLWIPRKHSATDLSPRPVTPISAQIFKMDGPLCDSPGLIHPKQTVTATGSSRINERSGLGSSRGAEIPHWATLPTWKTEAEWLGLRESEHFGCKETNAILIKKNYSNSHAV